MKKMNIIEIRGIRGLIVAGMIACCLAAGFIVFPGWLAMNFWNYLVSYTQSIPTIGLFQGVLLWGIIIAAYFTFKKDRIVVCFKTPKGLSEEELKSVFADIKKQSETDPVLKAMLKARETELKLKEAEKVEEATEEQASEIHKA